MQTATQTAENPSKKPNFSQLIFLSQHILSLHHREVPESGASPSAQHSSNSKILLAHMDCTCGWSLLLYRRLCQLSHWQQTRSAAARAWISVTGSNFPSACGAGTRPRLSDSAPAQGSHTFFSPLNQSPQAQDMPWGKGAGNRHCFKQLCNPALASKHVEKEKVNRYFVFLIYLLFCKWEGRGEHRE